MKESHSQHAGFTITLEPLRTKGPAALFTHDPHFIADPRLCQLELAWDNTSLQHTILKSQDLLKPSRGKLLTRGNLASATFAFGVKEADSPHLVTVRPPDKVFLQFPADAAQVHDWLNQTGFRLPKQTAVALAGILLAIATALAPCIGDGDGDDDDPDGERISLRA